MRRSSPFLWAVLAILGLALVLLLLREDSGDGATFNDNRVLQAALLFAILVFVVAGIFGRGSFGRNARNALIWCVIVVVALVGYTYREELDTLFQRVKAEFFPGDAADRQETDGGTVVIAQEPRSNHFIALAMINNAPIEMLVDTGATVITLTPEDARLAGLLTRRLQYVVEVATANGTARAAPVVLDRIAVGPIEQRRVSALVAEEGALEMSLLGLNFLQRLSSFTFAGGQLILTP